MSSRFDWTGAAAGFVGVAVVGVSVQAAAFAGDTPGSQPASRPAEPAGAVWQETELGQTAFFTMANAPYPHASRADGFTNGDKSFPKEPHYVDSTVALFIPKGYKPGARTDLLLYFHGHSNSVRKSLDQYRLREQVCAAGKNVILVCPEGPKDAGDSGGGKLEEPGGLQRLVAEVIDKLHAEGKIPGKQVGRVCLAGHSGAYRVISFCVEVGGLDAQVSDVCLLDASYGRLDAFVEWVARHPAGRLFSIFTEHLADENKDLMTRLGERKVEFTRLENLPPDAEPLRKPRIVFLATTQLTHDQTVQWLEPWLRATTLPDVAKYDGQF